MAQNAGTANREDVKQLMNEVDRLAEKARALLARAEEQENKEAVAEIEIALKWISEAKRLIADGNYDDASNTFRVKFGIEGNGYAVVKNQNSSGRCWQYVQSIPTRFADRNQRPRLVV